MAAQPPSQNLTFSGQPVSFNETLWNAPYLCTLSTCPKDWGVLDYLPSLGGNAFLLAWFAVLLVAQTAIGIQNRAWTYLIAMFGGCVLEVIGYVARIQMHQNIFDFNYFLMYLICLTIGPVFFAAAIYLTFTRLILLHGAQHARFKPKIYTIIFITWDIISLVLQAVGGALADTAADDGTGQTGINIMIAGLASQVASLAIFMILCADFAFAVWRAEGSNCLAFAHERLASLGRGKKSWYGLTVAVVIATLTILVRSCYRVAELRGGFSGELANDEVTFMVLEGAMVAVAALALTVAHPGLVFGRVWKMGRAVEVFGGVRGEMGSVREVDGGLEKAEVGR